MREAVPERRQLSLQLGLHAQMFPAPAGFIFLRDDFREAPQTAPDASRRTALQPHPVLRVAQDQEAGAPDREPASGLGRGIRLRVAGAISAAVRAQRAMRTVGPPAGADGGAHIHDGLGVGRDVAPGQIFFRQPPQFPFDLACARMTPQRVIAHQHAFHVAVQDGVAQAVGEGEDRARRGAADAGQPAQRFEVARPAAMMFQNDPLGAAMQVAGAGVIAQPRPQSQHFIQRCGRQRANIGEPRHETSVVRNDGGHLGLLQHDLRDPDAVGIRGVLPGQVVAAVAAMPAQQTRAERIMTRHGRPGPPDDPSPPAIPPASNFS